MKRTTAVALIAVAISFSAVAASACGDKLLHLSRIHRSHAFSNTGSIVVFARPNSLLENAANIHLASAFQDAGHKLLLVNTDRELTQAIQSGVADVVIVDIADAALAQRLASTSPTTTVIPVIAKGDRQSESDAKHYVAVIKSPAKSGRFVDAVD